MSAEAFERLCRDLCEAASAVPPRLVPAPDSTLSFHWRVGDCVATAVHRPAASETDILLFIDIGPMPDDVGVRGWKALMQANLQMYGNKAPRIGLSAADHLVVHVGASLGEATGQGLQEMVAGLSSWIHRLHADLREEESRAPDLSAVLAAAPRA